MRELGTDPSFLISHWLREFGKGKNRSVLGLLCLGAEKVLEEIQIQAFRLACREMMSIERHGRGVFKVCYTDLFLCLSEQSRLKTLMFWLIHRHREPNGSLPNRKTKDSLIGNLTSGQNIS